MLKFVLIAVVLFVSYSDADVAQVTKCPVNWLQVSLEPKFDFGKFMGTWYEIYYYAPGRSANKPKKWDNYDVNLVREGSSNTAKVSIHATDMQYERCFTSTGSGSMRLEADSSELAKMKFVRSRTGETDTHAWVVATDYKTYAVVIQCPWNNLRDGNCTTGTEIDILARQNILIEEFDVRKLVGEKLCRDFDNGFYEVYHNQDCASGGMKLAYFNSVLVLPWLLIVLHVTRRT